MNNKNKTTTNKRAKTNKQETLVKLNMITCSSS